MRKKKQRRKVKSMASDITLRAIKKLRKRQYFLSEVFSLKHVRTGRHTKQN